MNYDAIETCQHGVPDWDLNSMENMECGQPACMIVWWQDDKSDTMFVCAKHFNEVLESEKLNEEDNDLS